MKVIELLNKIANGEEVPKEIMYDNQDFYWCEPCKIYERFGDAKDLYNLLDNLNDEIEIIEEPQEHKIPEKLTIGVNVCDEIQINNEIYGERQVREVAIKVNEIIDYLEEIKNE